jgi:hypothetical protein
VDCSDEESIEVPVIGKIEPAQIKARLYMCTELLEAGSNLTRND